MKMKDTRGESQQGWVRLQIPSDFTLHWINLVDQSLTPHISFLPLSTPKGEEQTIYFFFESKQTTYREGDLGLPSWASLPTLQKDPQS